ncbi:hypothetical protein ACFSL4_01575 [Streptomyces caeni]|uniref:Heme exporter protein D n=1 Tax=Streptomyces caeni TaxID=2307231 RepID=A0ABW4IJ56_9ACTN
MTLALHIAAAWIAASILLAAVLARAAHALNRHRRHPNTKEG